MACLDLVAWQFAIVVDRLMEFDSFDEWPVHQRVRRHVPFRSR